MVTYINSQQLALHTQDLEKIMPAKIQAVTGKGFTKSLTEELLATDGCWETESPSSSGSLLVLQRMVPQTSTHILAALSGFKETKRMKLVVNHGRVGLERN